MCSRRVREESVLIKRRSSHRSKRGDRELMNTSSCAESLMLADSSTANVNRLASLLTFVCRERVSCWQYHLDGIESYKVREQLMNSQFPYQNECT